MAQSGATLGDFNVSGSGLFGGKYGWVIIVAAIAGAVIVLAVWLKKRK